MKEFINLKYCNNLAIFEIAKSLYKYIGNRGLII
jgi:hypothetical protein